MTNARKKNVIYIDEAGIISVDALKPICYAIMVTPSEENCRITIKESVEGLIVIDVLIALKETRFIDFGDLNGIELTSEFEISTFQNCESIIMYGSWLQPVNRARG